jgi:MoxR-like ATPase
LVTSGSKKTRKRRKRDVQDEDHLAKLRERHRKAAEELMNKPQTKRSRKKTGSKGFITVENRKTGEKQPIPVTKSPRKPIKTRKRKAPDTRETVVEDWDPDAYIEWLVLNEAPVKAKPVPETVLEKPPTNLDLYEDRALMLDYSRRPIPDTGEIGKTHAPLIRWSRIETKHMPPEKDTVEFYDYPHPDAPYGILERLRKAFQYNRAAVTVGKVPFNVMLQGPPGTGKTYAVKKFAEETQLPYYFVPADPNVMSTDELLGYKEIATDSQGRTQTLWHDGTITKAARNGGILHIDEFSLLDGEIQARLHELFDAQRRLSLEGITSETIKAHPDLFVVVTLNPPEHARHAKPVSQPLMSRFDAVVMGYPPLRHEVRILQRRLELSPDELEPPLTDDRYDAATGKYGEDVTRFMHVVHRLRSPEGEDETVEYVPSLREALRFTDLVTKGMDTNTAVHWALLGKYTGEERLGVVDVVKTQFGDFT